MLPTASRNTGRAMADSWRLVEMYLPGALSPDRVTDELRAGILESPPTAANSSMTSASWAARPTPRGGASGGWPTCRARPACGGVRRAGHTDRLPAAHFRRITSNSGFTRTLSKCQISRHSELTGLHLEVGHPHIPLRTQGSYAHPRSGTQEPNPGCRS